jgi:mRNA-degrading endonuclease toxin of MazEF toxin-antitoxin module
MSLARGDVVILDFPQAPGQPPKRRPAVVVQSDRNNGRLTNSIFAMVTSNTRLCRNRAGAGVD